MPESDVFYIERLTTQAPTIPIGIVMLAVDAGMQHLPVTEKDVAPTFTGLVLPEVSCGFELHFPGGVRLVVSGSVDAVWLRQLIFG